MSNQQIEAIFADLDSRGETAAPGDPELEEDTAGPTDEEQDTAAAELEAEEADVGDLRALARVGKRSLSLEEVAAIQARARLRGQRVGVVKTKAKPPARPAPPVQLPQFLVPPGAGFRTLVERWNKRREPFIINQAGSYYYCAEIICVCDGSPERAALRIPAGTYTFFDKAIDDDTSFLGNPTKITTDLTNFQRPSKNTSAGREFLVQSISMMEAGLRVKYDENDISAANVGSAAEMLRGKAWLWDDSGLFLPSEIFHDQTGENLLYRALRRAGTLSFRWEKKSAGANGTRRVRLIDHLRNIPDVRLRSLARTSGGAPVLPVPDGYIFADDPESRDGAFSAALELHTDVYFPVRGVDLGAGKKAKPLQVGLYVQLNLNGVGFQLRDAEQNA